LHVYRELASG